MGKSKRQAGARKQMNHDATPEMIEAGVAVLNAHASDEYRILSDEDIVRMIYDTMNSRCHSVLSLQTNSKT